MSDHVCPWWFACSLDNPLRRRLHNPARILKGLLTEGQTAIDLGCGTGIFTVAMAEMVGSSGKVIAVDLQEKMLQRTGLTAAEAGMSQRVRLHQCQARSIGLEENADFILAFWMVHEISDHKAFLAEVSAMLKPCAHFLLVEPKLHVPKSDFDRTVEIANQVGLKPIVGPQVALSRSQLFTL